MVRICRAEDGEVFDTNATIRDIEGSGSLEIFLRKEIGIEEDAALAYLSDGRRLRTDNVLDLADVQDQTIFVFNKYYLDRDPDEVAKLLHMEPPLQPPIEQSEAISLRLSDLGAAVRRTTQTHVQSISRIVDSMRYQRSALRLASSVVDSHVLIISDIVTDARQELDKRAFLVADVDGATDLASRVRIHREFMSPAVQRAMDAGGSARTLGHYVSGERIRRAVEEFRDLQERLCQVEATVKRFVDGATEARSRCADVGPLDTAAALELSSQSLRDKIVRVTSTLDAPVVNAERILQELRSSDASIRGNLTSVVELKNAYTSHCLRTFRQIHTLNADLVALPDDLTGLQASLETKGTFSDIERLHNIVYAYGATMVEVIRRNEFARLFHRKCQGFSEVMSNLSAAETERRQAFRDEILGHLPFDLIGMDETLPSVEISTSGGANDHYTLERHDISDLLRVLNDSRQAPNDNEAVPVKVQEVCTSLEGLVGNIDALESDFDALMERSLFSSSKQTISGIPQPVENSNELKSSEPEAVNHGEQPQAAVNDHERVQLLERELHLARTQLESEIAARRVLEDQLNSVRSILEPSRQQERSERRTGTAKTTGGSGRSTTCSTSAGDGTVADLQRAGRVRETTTTTHAAQSRSGADIAQLLEVAAAYRRTCTKALLALGRTHAVPSTTTTPNNNDFNSETEEVEGPPPPAPTPVVDVDVDLSDPVRAIGVLRSFDHEGLLEAVAKTGKTVRKWQKQCKAYRERSKAKIAFRNFAEGDLALFLPTRNSASRPWAAFNVSFPHYFLQASGFIAEQTKTREWIVARITSILERVAEPNDPDSNPYGLGDGVKYYMLQVEDWTTPKQQRPSKRASRPGAAPAVAVAAAVVVASAGEEDAGVPEE